jgi:ABC-type branched-subunit amino acid transport system ATPase component
MVSTEAVARSPEIALESRSLVKSFGGVRAVDDLSACFAAGTITALVGPNGAGKTSLFHLLSGALRPDRGEVLYHGRRIDGLPPWQVARLGIGRLFQDTRVFPRLTVAENVLVGFPRQLGESPVSSLLRRPQVARQERERAAEAAALLEQVGLGPLGQERAEQLSYGQQKLLAVARLLAAGAAVLLLDEPTAGINPAYGGRLLEMMRQLAGDGRTVVLIEHDMRVVLEVADRVYFMDRGRITAAGTAREVLNSQAVRAHYVGL